MSPRVANTQRNRSKWTPKKSNSSTDSVAQANLKGLQQRHGSKSVCFWVAVTWCIRKAINFWFIQTMEMTRNQRIPTILWMNTSPSFERAFSITMNSRIAENLPSKIPQGEIISQDRESWPAWTTSIPLGESPKPKVWESNYRTSIGTSFSKSITSTRRSWSFLKAK